MVGKGVIYPYSLHATETGTTPVLWETLDTLTQLYMLLSICVYIDRGLMQATIGKPKELRYKKRGTFQIDCLILNVLQVV